MLPEPVPTWPCLNVDSRADPPPRRVHPRSRARDHGGRAVSEQQRSQRVLGTFATGVIIGVVEALLAISFAAFVFGGRLIFSLDDGIGLYLGAAAITLAFVAWRAGSRG